MDTKKDCFSLRIREFTKSTLCMSTLAEYMKDFANLLGEAEHVHFKSLTSGSAVLNAVADNKQQEEKIRLKLVSVTHGNASDNDMKAYHALNSRLRKDNATAQLSLGKSKLLTFPGKKDALPPDIGPIIENTEIEGELIRVGGKDESIHMLLLDSNGQQQKLSTKDKQLAIEMAQHLFSKITVKGLGSWTRTADKGWILNELRIAEFSPVEEVSFADLVLKLQSIEGTGWSDMTDPITEALNIRGN